ncbi:MAG: Rieske 2Fe-2S domain-containing protein [Acidobacteriota bacterium]
MAKCRENKRKPHRTDRLATVARVDDLPRGRGARVKLHDGSQVALFNVKGEFYAIENFCPHRGLPLANSPVHGHKVECEHHGWRFDLRDGRCLKKRKCSVESYEVVVEDGWIKIKV